MKCYLSSHSLIIPLNKKQLISLLFTYSVDHARYYVPFIPIDLEDDRSMMLISKPEDSRRLARLRTMEAQEKDHQHFDSKHKMVFYKPGDLVWIFKPVLKVGL
ncbi:hypothetical protein AVEN_266760-1 [Araneus ventricosus]|uniref:Uncharacterized protein n=1 Tax=Araneus ventricosus TaxID=182803 RepID=A0A4Y2L7X5_ARAVE|nr:hypothetical protein AVEN_266760-1 [Araneus ventricosus]